MITFVNKFEKELDRLMDEDVKKRRESPINKRDVDKDDKRIGLSISRI